MDEYHSLIRETFVLRLWREATNHAWHGQIVHLPDQEAMPFRTLAEAASFIGRFAPDIAADQTTRHDNPGESAAPTQTAP